MAITFPASPLNNDIDIENSMTFVYDSTFETWMRKSSIPATTQPASQPQYGQKTISTTTTLDELSEYETGSGTAVGNDSILTIPFSSLLTVNKYSSGKSL